MEEFIGIIITVLLVWYIIKALARIFLPMLFQNVVNKAQQQQQNYRQNYNTNSNQAKVKVDYVPQPKKGSVPDSEGEYIGYEEIK
jgi:hypothetical protein